MNNLVINYYKIKIPIFQLKVIHCSLKYTHAKCSNEILISVKKILKENKTFFRNEIGNKTLILTKARYLPYKKSKKEDINMLKYNYTQSFIKNHINYNKILDLALSLVISETL